MRSDEAGDKYDERRLFEEENKHLAIPFPVEGLQDKIPPQYPTEMTMFGAPSGDGKSLFLKFVHQFIQLHVEKKQRRAVTPFISHEDTTEMTVGKLIEAAGGRETVDDDLTLYIGRSFGMSPDDVADLHMTNVFKCLDYGQSIYGDGKMQYASIIYDYIQTTPPDPFRREMTTQDQRRAQLADDTKRLFIAATTYSCPVWVGAQTGLKVVKSGYSDKMPIPGRMDFEEAKEIYQIPDRVYSGWLVGNTHPVGTLIESGNWRFKVEPNLFFLRVLKVRYHTPETCPAIRRIYPLRIQKDGSFLYDAQYHKSLLIGGDAK